MLHFLLPLAQSRTQNIRASSYQALTLRLTSTTSSSGSPACKWKLIPRGRSVCPSVHPSTYLSVLFLPRTLIQCLPVCRGVLTCIYCDPPHCSHPVIPHPHGPSKSAPSCCSVSPQAWGCSRDGLSPLQYTEPGLCPEQWPWGPSSLSREAFRMGEDTGIPVTFPQPSCTPAAGLAPTGSFPPAVSSPDPELCSRLLSGTSWCCHP